LAAGVGLRHRRPAVVEASFGGAGHDQLGVARSTDLVHSSVPPN
jgi:hypothetical protein